MTYLNLVYNKSSYFFLFLTLSLFWIGCNNKKTTTPIYDSDEFKFIDNEIINSGESVWERACFRCHMYGTNGAVSLENNKYWDNASSKGIDKLFDNVWNGIQTENSMMPPKGFCNTCTEHEIKNSILYLFHLSQKIQNQEKLKEDE
tara:strand:- start:352 stop:789 length:438 start_codon:yes stop_codon:yes gene_type:complete